MLVTVDENSSLNIRKEASQDAEVVGKFYHGSGAEVLEVGAEWTDRIPVLAIWLARSNTLPTTPVVSTSAALAETAVVTDETASAAVMIPLSITFLNFI